MAKVKCSRCAFLNDSSAARCHRCGTALPSISFEEQAVPPPGDPAPARQDAFQFKRGQVINNRYTVLDMIGRGGMGCIYKVHDNVLGEDLALKTLLPQYVTDRTVIDRFLNEARITRKLTHPNIVRVHDIGTAGKGIFISMEYVEGDSLRTMLGKYGPGERIPVRQVLHIIEQLCLALDYAHQFTVHRDIKPENVMITENNQIKLMDFGISKLMDNRLMTSASIVMGTPYYMSPEQHRNTRDVDARADIYSVGVVMYEMLTGNMPTGVPKPASQVLKEIPPALDEIVEKCIDPNREKRFNTAGELRRAILPIIEMLDEGKDPQKTLARRRLSASGARLSWRRMLPLGAAISLVIGASAFSLYALERMNAPALAKESPAVVLLPSGEKERFAMLESLVESLQSVINNLPDMNTERTEWRDRGRELWGRAAAAAHQGDGAAIALAENALQHFMAILMNPEGMVFVPAGIVEMDGITISEPGFFIEAAEVTLSQFAGFCDQVTDGWPMEKELHDALSSHPEYPVSFVAWFDAQAYAAWKGRQLPSRSQWERAAYGDNPDARIYPWGAEWKPEAANMDTGYSRPPKSYKEDLVWSGCYDMAGNMAEWTSSLVLEDTPQDMPFFGDLLHVCGGSFLRTQPMHATAQYAFETRLPDLGFRCVLPVPITPEAVAILLNKYQ